MIFEQCTNYDQLVSCNTHVMCHVHQQMRQFSKGVRLSISTCMGIKLSTMFSIKDSNFENMVSLSGRLFFAGAAKIVIFEGQKCYMLRKCRGMS